jgi:hypothetical protein
MRQFAVLARVAVVALAVVGCGRAVVGSSGEVAAVEPRERLQLPSWATSLERERAAAALDPRFHPVSGPEGVEVTSDGARAVLSGAGARLSLGTASGTLSLASLGRAGALRSLSDGSIDVQGPEARLARDGATEWWRALASGLEHGVTIASRPSGEGAVVLELHVGGGLRAAEGDDAMAWLLDAAGRRVASYERLLVVDADGGRVPATMTAAGGAIRITLDDAGARYPLVVDPLVVVEEATLAPTAPAAGRRFGRAVALGDDGTIAVVGAPGDTGGAGAAHVLARTGSSWADVATLRPASPSPGAGFGTFVAVSGDGRRAAVGEPHGGAAGSGVVHVFASGPGGWSLEAALTITAPASGDELGAVALSADGATLVAGAPNDGFASCAGCGSATVFVRAGTTWTEQALLTSPDPAPFEAFGYAVDVSADGNRVVVGVPREDTFAADVGGARTFVRTGTTWGHEALLSVADGSTGDSCGLAAAISRDASRVVVGCPFDDTPALNAGTARVFQIRGGAWSLEATLAAVDGAADDNLGLAVDLSADGARAAVGAPRDDVGALADGGSVRVFDAVGASWLAQSTLTPAVHAAGDAFGRALALSAEGTRVTVGADMADAPGADSGRAWSYTLELPRGAPCARGFECDSGLCVDGVCCDTACGGGADDCQACSAALTGGADGTCAPLSASVAPTVVCRASAGTCDDAETCAAGSTVCPADVLAPSSRFCRVAAGPCDVAERCTGASVDCPADVIAAAGVECRPVAGDCDVAEQCGGASVECPVDGFVALGTLCRAARGVCDVAETCNGAQPNCPRDRFQPEGASCANATRCDGDELCAAGACMAGAPLDCDDGDLCTADACDALAGCASTPVAGCCAVDGDCDDGDVCTADRCGGAGPGVGGTCAHEPIAGCVPFDAGAGGTDAGGAARDAGALDAAGSGEDGGVAADGALALDAGSGVDAGGGPSGGGCSCHAVGTRAGAGWLTLGWLTVGVVGGVALGRGRRPRRR